VVLRAGLTPAAPGPALVRIVVDVSPLGHQRTGIGNYLLGMLRGLAEAIGDEDELVVFALAGPRRKRVIEGVLDGLPVERRIVLVPPSAHTWRTAWSRIGRFPVERLVGRLDVFHFSDWMYPPQRAGLRTTTIYDLIPVHFPEWVAPLTRRMHGRKYDNAARTCDLIFAISSYTADDVAETLSIPRERVRVAYPGVDGRFRPEGERRDLGAPYVLGVSTVEPRKNLEVLLEAFALVRRRHPELVLAVAGPSGWASGEGPSGEAVRWLGFVPDSELPALYRGARASVYPSRFEGFGIPIVEAMACGTPVVSSAHPSLDEASGDVALRADPSSPEAFADAIERALEAPDELVRRGLELASLFTWGACGDAVVAGYREAL
jgi:glycosyltransferase involved in cell wall biosynthesis